MPIHYNLTSLELPLMMESIGNRWDQEEINRPNGYPLYHWLQTEHGCGTVVIGGTSINLPEGAGICIAPFVPHVYYRKTREWITSFITFTGSLRASIVTIIGHKPVVIPDIPSGKKTQAWIDSTIEAHVEKQLDLSRLSVECYAFFLALSENHQYQHILEQPLYKQYVLPAMQEIETRYNEPISTHMLASSLYISPQYLTRLFSRFLGCSVYTYLIDYRINKAKEMLVNLPSLGVKEIASRVGYLDASHFIAVFKKKTGFTPLGYRQLHIQNKNAHGNR